MNYDMKLYDWGAKNQRLPYRVSHEKGFHDLFWSTIFLVTGTVACSCQRWFIIIIIVFIFAMIDPKHGKVDKVDKVDKVLS